MRSGFGLFTRGLFYTGLALGLIALTPLGSPWTRIGDVPQLPLGLIFLGASLGARRSCKPPIVDVWLSMTWLVSALVTALALHTGLLESFLKTQQPGIWLVTPPLTAWLWTGGLSLLAFALSSGLADLHDREEVRAQMGIIGFSVSLLWVSGASAFGLGVLLALLFGPILRRAPTPKSAQLRSLLKPWSIIVLVFIAAVPLLHFQGHRRFVARYQLRTDHPEAVIRLGDEVLGRGIANETIWKPGLVDDNHCVHAIGKLEELTTQLGSQTSSTSVFHSAVELYPFVCEVQVSLSSLAHLGPEAGTMPWLRALGDTNLHPLPAEDLAYEGAAPPSFVETSSVARRLSIEHLASESTLDLEEALQALAAHTETAPFYPSHEALLYENVMAAPLLAAIDHAGGPSLDFFGSTDSHVPCLSAATSPRPNLYDGAYRRFVDHDYEAVGRGASAYPIARITCGLAMLRIDRSRAIEQIIESIERVPDPALLILLGYAGGEHVESYLKRRIDRGVPRLGRLGWLSRELVDMHAIAAKKALVLSHAGVEPADYLRGVSLY